MNIYRYILFFFGTIGLLDSGYLYWARITGSDLSCSILEGCNQVAQSPYSVMFGVPLSLWGVLFYTFIIGATLLLIGEERTVVRRLLLFASIFGFLSSIYFVYVQASLIGAFCMYCIISAVSSTILFVTMLFYMRAIGLGKHLENSLESV